jgi:signal transduction histidine kinase
MSLAAGPHATAQPVREASKVEAGIFLWAVSALTLSILVYESARHVEALSSRVGILIPWVLLHVIINLLPVPGWESTALAVDWPASVAAALVLRPAEAALVTFIGALDVKELRRQITVSKAIFNRSQIGLHYFLGSLVAHRLVASPATSKYILPLAFLILGQSFVLNYVLVGFALRFERGYAVSEVVRRLKVGTLPDFALAFLAWGALGGMLAALYDQIQLWALLAFLGPILLTRQILIRSQSLLDATQAYHSRGEAIVQISREIGRERSDERRLIAGDLHDEVLQPLYKISLMAHLLKAEMATGRLLDMEQDLPDLLVATELASTALRELIGDLRRSSLGRGDLSKAILSLVRDEQGRSQTRFEVEMAEVVIDTVKQLALYQIAKEALGNALTHSRARTIKVELTNDAESVRLTVKDDGVGFDPFAEHQGHFGLHIMRERIASIGGQLFIDSGLGQGTSLTALVPKDDP